MEEHYCHRMCLCIKFGRRKPTSEDRVTRKMLYIAGFVHPEVAKISLEENSKSTCQLITKLQG